MKVRAQRSLGESADCSEESEGSVGPSGFCTPIKGAIRDFKRPRVTSRKFEDTTLNRFDLYEQRKKEKLLVQKKEIMRSELQQYTATPQINKQKKRDRTRNPLVSRLDEILMNRKIRIDSKRDKIETKEEIEARECTFRPSINSTSVNRSVEDLFKWQEIKKQRLMEKSLEVQNGPGACKFKPEISKQSRVIMQKRTHDKEFQKVEDRLLGYLKRNKDADKSIIVEDSSSTSRLNKSSILRQTPQNKDKNDLSRLQLVGAEPEEAGTFRGEKEKPCERELLFSFKKWKEAEESKFSSKTYATPQLNHPPELTFSEVNPVQSKNKKKQETFSKEDDKENQPSINLQTSSAIPLKSESKNGTTTQKAAKKPSHAKLETDQAPPPTCKTLRALKKEVLPTKELSKSRPRILKSKSPAPSNDKSMLSKPSVQESVKSSVNKSPLRHSKTRSAIESVDKSSAGSYKMNKSEITEKYAVKVKPQLLDAKDLRETMGISDTSSMLQNLKRVNSNLRKLNGFECIIKDSNKHTDSRSTHGQSQSQSQDEQNYSNPFLRHFDEAPKGKKAPAHPNPFIELFAENAFIPHN